MGATPVFFDLPANRTVDNIGIKTVAVRTTGRERSHFTTILACMAKNFLPWLFSKDYA